MRFANTFQAQTPIGAAIQSLGEMMFSGPSPVEVEKIEAERAYREAMTKNALLEADLNQGKLDAGTSIAGLIKGMGTPQAGGTVDASLQGGIPDLTAMLLRAGEVGQLPELYRALAANYGASDDSVIRSMAGAGNAIGVNEAVSLGGQSAVRDANLRGDLAKIYATPFETSAGAVTTPGMGDPRGPVYGRDTEATAKGAAFNALDPALAALAVGPSETQVNANTIFGLPPEDQRIAALGDNAFGSPLERVASPDSPSGITLTPRAEAAGMPGVAPAAATRDDVLAPTTATRSAAQATIASAPIALSLIDQIEQIASSKEGQTAFGAIGWLRGTLQDAILQGNAFASILGSESERVRLEILEMGSDVGQENYDETLPIIDVAMNLLAWEMAKIANTDGRVSNQDFNNMKDNVGGGGWLGNPKEVLTRMKVFRQFVNTRVAAAQSSVSPGAVQSAPAAAPGVPAASGAASGGSPDGTTAINKATGERMIKRGGKWVPFNPGGAR